MGRSLSCTEVAALNVSIVVHVYVLSISNLVLRVNILFCPNFMFLSPSYLECVIFPYFCLYITFIIIEIRPSLKGQCHEIFDLWFFSPIDYPRPQMNTLKYFRILFRIRLEIIENVLIPHYAAYTVKKVHGSLEPKPVYR
jgi:hypothetical protein